MAVCMRKVLATPWVGVRVCHCLLLLLFSLQWRLVLSLERPPALASFALRLVPVQYREYEKGPLDFLMFVL